MAGVDPILLKAPAPAARSIRNPISFAGLPHVAAPPALREPNRNHGRFTDKGLRLLEPLQGLERIAVFRTGTGNAGAEALTDQKSLAVVILDYTAVDNKGLEALQGLPRLR